MQYGNSGDYLARRLARDRPDVLERMKAGEFKSVRAAAIEAGILPNMPTEDKALERLCLAWAKATLDDRRVFLSLMEREIEAALAGEYLNEIPCSPGYQKPYPPLADEPMPEIETLLHAGYSVSGIARMLGVSYRTVERWRHGYNKPRPAMRAKLLTAHTS
jgi:DNA invertase Pin-like site-specific DNA recombinase